MKKIFRMLALTLIIATVFNGVCITSHAEYISGNCGAMGSNVEFSANIDSGYLSISGTGKIDASRFRGMTFIREVYIESGVTGIGDGAFVGCTNLWKITIPKTVTYMGPRAFDGCESLKEVYIDDLASWCKINRTNTFGSSSADSNPLYYADELYVDYELLSSNITIPHGVKEIKEYAFAGFSNLKSISIPTSVTSIGEGAFQDCPNLPKVEIPSTVTTIGDYAFSWCPKLASVSIPSGIKTIGERAFYECDSLTSISMLPSSVTSIGKGAFAGCDSLKSISVSESNKNYCAVDGVLYNKNNTTLVQYPAGKTTTSYTPQTTTTFIGDYAFYECENIKNIVLDKSISSIGCDAFNHCTNLEAADIYNDKVTFYDNYVFYNCKKLTIYGNKGSAADTYAKSNDIKFKTFLWKNIITPQAAVNNGKIDITVSVNKDIKNNKLFCAFYDAKGVLLKTQIIDVPSTSEPVKFNITDDSRYSYMKAALWNGMTPSAIIGRTNIR